MPTPKISLKKHIAQTPVAHLVIRSAAFHFHNLAGPPEPELAITYAKIGPNGESLGGNRVHIKVDADIRRRLEAGGNLEAAFISLLTETLGVA